MPAPRPPSLLRDRLLARRYRRAPIVDPRAHKSYDALVQGVEQQFRTLPVAVEFTHADAYGTSSRQMFRDIEQHGRLKVWTGSSDHPVLTPEQNWKFRAVHDYYGHYVPRVGFSRGGERAAFEAHRRMFPAEAHSALAAETEAQQAVYRITGTYAAEQKAVHVPWWLR